MKTKAGEFNLQIACCMMLAAKAHDARRKLDRLTCF